MQTFISQGEVFSAKHKWSSVIFISAYLKHIFPIFWDKGITLKLHGKPMVIKKCLDISRTFSATCDISDFASLG